MFMKKLKYISHYPSEIQKQVSHLIKQEKLSNYLLQKYESSHKIKNDKMLFEYVNSFKLKYFKKASPLSKVAFDGKINVIHNALGTHQFISLNS